MVITYNNAEMTFDAGDGDWVAGETAYVTVNDPDMNKFPTVAETLSVGDEDAIIPTIKMGSPLTLASSDGNNALKAGSAFANTGVRVGTGLGTKVDYTGEVNNTTDNSERLRIIHKTLVDGETDTERGGSDHTNTWINVTTAHSVMNVTNLEGTPVLNYDVSGPAGDLSSTAVAVYVIGTGSNTSGASDLDLVTSVNARSGVVDLDDGTQWFVNNDVKTDTAIYHSTTGGTTAASLLVGVAFKITHPAGYYLNATHDYAIAADFCNFDQDNGSSVHNCIYRIEAEETGEDTGIFEGEVSYIMLNNSTGADTDNGEAAGNDEEVESFLDGYTNTDAVTVVLMGTGDSVRVVYNDTDALQAADKIGEQLDAVTHSGTASLMLTLMGQTTWQQ